jgi:hypothetical protein
MNIPELTVLAPVCGADRGALEKRISAHPIRLTVAMATKFVCRIKFIVKNTVSICRELSGILLTMLQNEELNYVANFTKLC